MAAEKTFYVVVGLPLALWALQKAAEGLVAFRQTMRARLLDTTQLLDDIETNLATTTEMIGDIASQLFGTPSPLETRLAADKDYYIFSVAGEITVEVFRSDAVQRFSHLDSELFNDVKRFYDLQKIIAATFAAAMSDKFMVLSAARKLATMAQLQAFLKESVAIGERCRSPLKEEIEVFCAHWLWKALLLSHWKTKRLKEQSAGVAT